MRGIVVDRTTGKPIEGAVVAVEEPASVLPIAGSADRPRARSDAQGRFVIGGLAQGLVSLFTEAGGHHARVLSGVSLPESEEPPEVPVELSPLAGGEPPSIERAGLGIAVGPKGDAVLVGQVFPGGSGEEAGLVSGDLILAVDDVPVTKLGLEGATEAIRGAEGSAVMLAVRRLNGSEVRIAALRKLIRG